MTPDPTPARPDDARHTPTAAAMRASRKLHSPSPFDGPDIGHAEHLDIAATIDRETGLPDLLAVAREWVAYFDRLERNGDPSDPLFVARRNVHGKRVEATRAAIALAEGGSRA